VATEPLVDL